MPLISSFYGVLVYLYWLDTRQHHLPHIHAIMLATKRCSVERAAKYSTATCRADKPGWYRLGSNFVTMNCWPIGLWLSKVSQFFPLNL